jgi:glycosyltransferase involved in cell wall biosynthesis
MSFNNDLVHVVSINPDLVDDLGHYIHYENHLESHLRIFGIGITTIANKGFPLPSNASPDRYVKKYNMPSYKIGNHEKDEKARAAVEPPVQRVQDFIESTKEGLEVITGRNPEKILVVYMYCGSLWHAEALATLLGAYRQVRVICNLFWLPFVNIWTDDFSARWKQLLSVQTKTRRLKLTVTTKEMQQRIQQRCGHTLDVAPHPSTTFSDADYMRLAASPFRHLLETSPNRFLAYFPGLTRAGKGFELTVEASALISKKLGFKSAIRLVLESDTPSIYVKYAELARPHVEVIEGTMPNDAYLRRLQQANLLVLPYHPSEFEARTSGLLVDAMYIAQPVVAITGTWLARMISEYKSGLAISPTPEGIVEAVSEIAKNHEYFSVNARKASSTWFSSNSWQSLCATIVSMG